MTKSENKYRQLTRRQEYTLEREQRAREKKYARNIRIFTGEEVKVREDLVGGRDAVIELLKSDKTIEQVFIANGKVEGSMNKILGLAKEKKIVVKEADRKKLDLMSETKARQGVIAQITPFEYSTVEDILGLAKSKNEDPFIVILDELGDPHNLGSIVRTAELCDVHGVIIPKERNVGVIGTVYKASVGAIEHMKVVKVTNMNNVVKELEANNVRIYGADIAGEKYSYEANFKGACGIVIGSEGRGMSNLTKKKCDKLVKIPMVERINSLGASVVGGIVIYEILKSRIIE